MADKEAVKDNMEIKIGAKANQIVKCNGCQKEVPAGQYYTYKGKKGESVFLCEACRETTEKAFKAETQNPNMVMAAILGILAAIIAGVAWFLLSVLTGYQIGYVAIGVGFIIGHAVIWGAGKKRGASLQILSAAITIVTLLISQYVIVLYYIHKYLLEHRADYPGYNGQWIFVSPFNPDVLKGMFSPMGILIWAIGIYFAYSLPKARSI
jgi:hypothetical protein